MKYLLLSFHVILGFLSCTPVVSESKKPVNTKSKTVLLNPLDTAVYFSGIWVNERYAESVKTLQSPRESFKEDYIMRSCIVIPGRTLQITKLISSFHEGGGDAVVVKEGEKYRLYTADLKSVNSEIQILSPGRMKLFDEYFIKISQADTEIPGLGILQDILFSGTYRLAGGGQVTFGKDGRVSGLDSFKQYIPVIDYTTEEDSTADLLVLKGKTEHRYKYRFAQDSLSVYEPQGKKIYSLLRITR
ncbi:hypothetical protein [Chitinophaga tropicalis]|uniref:Lipoprotein n=1 Tax=Chitinophaga tropicalis TaxID=2683588 RepID=A0A7K1U8I5_9BACT|nr:hypothetical protein [Chitinophaga tropicalis]MVT10671.1 hypothetical protein [Chitinophaga tropicalis]